MQIYTKEQRQAFEVVHNAVEAYFMEMKNHIICILV